MAESELKDNIQGSECVDDGKILSVSLALGWRFIFDHLEPKYRQAKIERSIVNIKLRMSTFATMISTGPVCCCRITLT